MEFDCSTSCIKLGRKIPALLLSIVILCVTVLSGCAKADEKGNPESIATGMPSNLPFTAVSEENGIAGSAYL